MVVHRLNKATIKNQSPVPQINDSLINYVELQPSFALEDIRPKKSFLNMSILNSL